MVHIRARLQVHPVRVMKVSLHSHIVLSSGVASMVMSLLLV